MRMFAALLALLCLALLGRPAQARDEAGSPSGYVLGIEDVLDISVRNHSDLDRTLTVRPDGKISFPEVGELQAAGKTPQALSQEIQTALEKTRNNVSVVVAVKEVRSRQVRVVGAVKAPSAYDLKPGWRFMDLVSVAGGLTAKPNLITGRVLRGRDKILPFNCERAMADPAGKDNVTLEPGDLVLLDEQEPVRRQVFVMGQVNKPGAFDLDNSTTLLSLLSLAGNPTEQASLSKAYVMRGPTQIPINLRAVLIDGRQDEEVIHFKLQSGDALFIPQNEVRYAVMGQVYRPGFYALPERGEVTAITALNVAGGQTPDGDLGKAGIVRQVGGKWTVLPVNIAQMLKKGNLASNAALQKDDILYVPPRGRQGNIWQDILSPISALSLLGFRFVR